MQKNDLGRLKKQSIESVEELSTDFEIEAYSNRTNEHMKLIYDIQVIK